VPGAYQLEMISAVAYNRNIDKCLARKLAWLRRQRWGCNTITRNSAAISLNKILLNKRVLIINWGCLSIVENNAFINNGSIQ